MHSETSSPLVAAESPIEIKQDFFSTTAIDKLLETRDASIELQESSYEIWDTKYRLKDKNGKVIDDTVEASQRRVARALSKSEKNSELWNARFLKCLKAGAVPAGRIMSNAGAEHLKPGTSVINCTVSGSVPDSMDGILERVHEAGLTLKAGCGIGYEFSTLRPAGAFVSGVGATTSGPLTFMDIYDKMCFTVSSAGGRRGAQMGTFDINHPDAENFIKVKREDGRLRQFNLSLLITEDFLAAVKADKDWQLSFPMTIKEFNEADSLCNGVYDITTGADVVLRDMAHLSDVSEYKRVDGKVLCKVYSTVKARTMWDSIMRSTYDFAEPGFILVDRINKMNNNWFCEELRATNPCGEQPLPPYGSCLLGSINLTKFVVSPFDNATFNWAAYEETVRIFTRMLDNVVEMNGLPLPQQRREIESKRRHGMGFLGLGSTMTMLGMKYGSQESMEFTDKISYLLAINGWEAGVELAEEKGEAPILAESVVFNETLINKAVALDLAPPSKVNRGDSVLGTVISGRKLLLMSNYMHQFNETERGRRMLREAAVKGLRFTHHSSIAPTGTISLSIGNNASNGIEPSFSHHYYRNVIVQGQDAKVKKSVYSYELLRYMDYLGANTTPPPSVEAVIDNLPDYFTTANDLTPKQHIDIQAASQKWIDSSISKTANVPADIPFEEFKDIYTYAAEKGLKGCTTFRPNPAAFQGVLVTDKDLKAMSYTFTLADGTELHAMGNEEITYNGQTHTAANLADAIKEGYYQKL